MDVTGASPSRKRHHLTAKPHGTSPSRKRLHFMPSPLRKRDRPPFSSSSHGGSPSPSRAQSRGAQSRAYLSKDDSEVSDEDDCMILEQDVPQTPPGNDEDLIPAKSKAKAKEKMKTKPEKEQVRSLT
ncbi:hypothetical protein RIF29_16407 [Crotalaria pallida]|uniref:Uncharacterized protein n=1 Tax=Crotalaria pallida TaxID=3830 RepID=A0AAN9FL14_CROPI